MEFNIFKNESLNMVGFTNNQSIFGMTFGL